jgi:hypothetical protein
MRALAVFDEPIAPYLKYNFDIVVVPPYSIFDNPSSYYNICKANCKDIKVKYFADKRGREQP